MNPIPLAGLLRPLDDLIAADKERHDNVQAVGNRAHETTDRAPLVRRVGGSDGTWRQTLETRTLRCTDPRTSVERRAGITRTIYCFFGAPAYPRGDVALLLCTDLVTRISGSFWPFDTGALEQGYLVPAAGEAATSSDAVFRSYWGQSSDLRHFATKYLSAHFRNPMDYCTREQVSDPDFPPYHGLLAPSGDRRRWTLEVQLHEDVALSKESVHRIVLEKHAMLTELPDELVELAVQASDLPTQVRREVRELVEGTTE